MQTTSYMQTTHYMQTFIQPKTHPVYDAIGKRENLNLRWGVGGVLLEQGGQ